MKAKAKSSASKQKTTVRKTAAAPKRSAAKAKPMSEKDLASRAGFITAYRTKNALSSDKAKKAKRTFSKPTEAEYRLWKSNPGRYDIEGIDTPAKKKKPVKHREPTAETGAGGTTT